MKSISPTDCLAFGFQFFFLTKINVNNEIKIFKNSNSMDSLRRMNNFKEPPLRSPLLNFTTFVLVSKKIGIKRTREPSKRLNKKKAVMKTLTILSK